MLHTTDYTSTVALGFTNPKLSSNIKIVVDNDSLYLDVIQSTSELSRSKYSKFKIDPNTALSESIHSYCSMFIDKNELYKVKQDKITIQRNLSDQYDQTYQHGAYSKSYASDNMHAFFAPIILNDKIPDGFVIFRKNSNDESLISYIDFHACGLYDLLTEHVEKKSSLFFDASDGFAVTGLNLNTGLVETRYENMQSKLLSNERTITEFDSFVNDVWMRNQLIDHKIVNLEFMFSNSSLDAFFDCYGEFVYAKSVSKQEFDSSKDKKFLIGTEVQYVPFGTVYDYIERIRYYSTLVIAGYDIQYPMQCVLNMIYNPEPGDKITVSYGEYDITYIVQESDLCHTDRILTRKNIVNALNSLYEQGQVVKLFAYMIDERIVISASTTATILYDLKITELPKNTYLQKPSLYSEFDNEFTDVREFDILIRDQDIPINSTHVKYCSQIQKIERIFTYYASDQKYSVIRCTGQFAALYSTKRITMISYVTDDMIVTTPVKMLSYDTNTEFSYHADVLDFDLDAYKTYLLNLVSDIDYFGKYTSSLGTELAINCGNDETTDFADSDFDGLADNFTASGYDNVSILFDTIYNRIQHIENVAGSECKLSYQIDQSNKRTFLTVRYKSNSDVLIKSFSKSGDILLPKSTEYRLLVFDTVPSANELVFQLQKDFDSYFDLALLSLHDMSEVSIDANILSYREQVKQMIYSYFKSIDLNRSMLCKSIDAATGDVETISNEYERLKENDNIELLKHNKINRKICKLALRNATDAYNNPYRLNIALPFRTDNFSPTHYTFNRSVSNHTHAWYIIGEGPNPYFAASDHRQSGYSKRQLSEQMLIDRDHDAFEYLNQYSTISSENGVACTTFRGIKLKFDNKFEGYRFAVVLLTKNVVKNLDRTVELYKNDTFKTLTLLVRMYIPEPILTGCERPDLYAFDRSILYFSDNKLETEPSFTNIVSSAMSLTVFDSENDKYFKREHVGKSWLYEHDGIKRMHVSKGDVNIFNDSFKNLIGPSSSLSVAFGDVSLTSSYLYGMKITFQNIVDVNDDYFWCSDIKIEIKSTNGLDTQSTLDDTVTARTYQFIEQYTNDNSILDTNNDFAILKGVLYSNIVVNTTEYSSTSTSKYDILSASSILSFLNNNEINVYSDLSESKTIVRSIKPKHVPALISLTTKINSIVSSDSVMTYPLARLSGYYEPILIDSSQFNAYRVSKHVQVPQVLTDISRDVNDYWIFDTNNDVDLSSFYKVYTNNQDSVDVNWIACPIEFKRAYSKVLSTLKTIEFEFQLDDMQTIDMSQLPSVQSYVDTIINNSGISVANLSYQAKQNILYALDIYTNDIESYNIYDAVRKLIFNEMLMKLYIIDSVKDDTGNKILFERVSINQIKIKSKTLGKLTIKMTR